MKRFVGIFLLSVFLFSFVSAESFSSITGRVIEGLDYDISQMSEAELLTLYEENKDFISKEESDEYIKEYEDEIPKAILTTYKENEDILMDFSFDESVLENLEIGALLNIFPCSMITGFVEDEIIGTEIPKELPLDNVFFDLYIDEEFFISLEIKDKKVSGLYCDESEDVGFQIFITSELIMDVALNYEEIEPIEFYKEKKKSGDLKIKAKGIGNRIKLLVLNIGVKFL